MTTLAEVLKGIRETIVLMERVEQLARKVDEMETRERDLLTRLAKLEAFVDFVRPAIIRRGLPPADTH